MLRSGCGQVLEGSRCASLSCLVPESVGARARVCVRMACVGARGSYTSQTKRLKEKLVELESAFAALSREAAQAS